MWIRRGLLLGVCVLLLAVLTAPGVAQTTTENATATNATATNATATNATAANETDERSAAFGTELSAFMQANAGETEDTVENRLWSQRHEKTDQNESSAAVEARTRSLSERLQQLRNRSQRLEARRANGSISEVAYAARASRLAAQLDALQRAVDDTETRAATTNANVSELETVRTGVASLGHGQIASATKGLQSVRKPRTGPPARVGIDAGPNGTGPPGLATNETGNRSDDSSNAAQKGPQDDSPGNSGGQGNDNPGAGGSDNPGNSGGQGNDNPGNSGGQGNDNPGNSGGQGNDNPGNSGGQGNDNPGAGGSDNPGSPGDNGAKGGNAGGADNGGNAGNGAGK
jgi:hypothetical protein